MPSFPLIALSLLIAALLELIHLPFEAPYGLHSFNISWVILTLIFWMMHYPRSIRLVGYFSIGLVLDVMSSSLFGLHALFLIVVAYSISLQYKQIRMFVISKQAIIVFALILALHILTYISAIHSGYNFGLNDILAPIVSAMLWPILSSYLKMFIKTWQNT